MPIASSSHPQISNPEIESKVLGDQVNRLFAHASTFHLVSLVVIALLGTLFAGLVSSTALLAWTVPFVIAGFLNLLLALAYQRGPIAADRAGRWRGIFRTGVLLAGIGWGFAGVVLFVAGSVAHELLLASVLLVVAAAALPLLAADLRSYFAFALFSVSPIAARLLYEAQTVEVTAGISVLASLALLLLLAVRMSRDLQDSMRTRFAYEDVVDEFDAEVTTRVNAENTLRRGERRARKQSYVLLDLAKEEAIANGNLSRALNVISEKAAQAIACTRVSVWFCDSGFTEFRCVHLFDNGYHDAEPNITLRTGDQSELLNHLARRRTFAVSDTWNDKRAHRFLRDYLAPYRVSALIGAPFRHAGKVRGVLVIEHVGAPRRWTRDERVFASSLADFLSLAISSSGRQEAQEQLQYMANYDRLTGLPNRAMFQDRLAHALTKAHRANREIALLFVDLDRFKPINDSLGHHIGDRILRGIAKRLMRCVRSADTVARLGGDEFTVIIEEIDELETVIAVCERILSTLAEPLMIGDKEMSLTCSIGIALFPNDGTDGQTLLQNADTAMYRAKQAGRNGYRFFTSDMHEQAIARLERETDLRKALQRQELRLVYQPQIDIETGRTIGVEALVRWQHPVKGLIAPDDFIPLAEDVGLISQIGGWVLREACLQARKWREQYHQDFHVAVNLSVGQFMVRNVAELIAEVLHETGLPPDGLLLEITESLAVVEQASTLKLLQDVKALGCRLALDDFGTGNSSLSYLKLFPVDIIKVDRSFVRDLPGDAHDMAIARATINLAHSLGLTVIAEGVEQAAQLQWLRAEGCHIMQGYLFTVPMPPEECSAWLQAAVDVKQLAEESEAM